MFRCIKSFYIENLGCTKNQVDAEKIISALIDSGYKYFLNPEDADVIIVNTCAFIQTAREESIDTALSFRAEYPGSKIVLSGCFSERYKNELTGLLPEINVFFGNKAPERIREVFDKLENSDNFSLYPDSYSDEFNRKKLLSFSGSVYIKISEGCNNNCTYCAIPLIRGSHRSRELNNVTNEISLYIEKGYCEIILVGQDLAAYNKTNKISGLPELLEKITAIEGDFWLRLLYIHPDNFPEEIIDLCVKDKRILPYFDIPFQHASEKILHNMGRKGNADKYIKLIKKIRQKLPEAVIRSTFMVGFPGEGENEFKELLDFQKKADLDWAGFFTYSREEGTPAFKLKGRDNAKISKKIALKRKELLEFEQINITRKRLERFVNTEMVVLVEEKVENETMVLARGYLQAPEVDGLIVVKGTNSNPGNRLNVKIIRCNGVDLEAVLV